VTTDVLCKCYTSNSMLDLLCLQEIQKHSGSKPFHLAGYSFGACVAIEMAIQMNDKQDKSTLKTLTLLDGSHKFVASYTGTYREHMTITESSHAETVALCKFMEKYMPEVGHQVRE